MTHFLRGAVAVLVAALVLGACGSSGSSPTTTAKQTSTTMSTAQTESQIRTAYATLFNLNNPAISPKLAVVQDGEALRAAISAELKSTLAKSAGGAKVVSIKLESASACRSEGLPSPCAAVVYDILSPDGNILLANSKGFALLQGSAWVVAKSTICGLLSLANGGTPPTGC